MSEFNTVLQAALPVFCMAMLGLLMRRINWLSAEADASLMRITVNLFTPCLIFDSILGNPAFEHAGNILLPPVVGFVTVAAGIGVAVLFSRMVGLPDLRARRTFAFSTGAYNYGYVSLPLALALFDQRTAGVLLVHNVGVEIALWTLGLWVLGGVNLREGWKRMFNPPVVAIIGTLAITTLFKPSVVPGFIRTTAHALGVCAIPLGVILIGAVIADHLGDFATRRGGRAMLGSCVVRLALMPLLFLGLALVLPATEELKRVIVIQASMPAAVIPIVMARHYGGDAPTALRVVIATSVVGMITLPLWLRWGMHLTGLAPHP